ncbi:MAG: hypothetical protein DCC65_15165 [Planctomycetota bacterium]|nr:MAG: hypothetical protein DCC65_15165 [Planctomycetota bacterium]
MSRTIIKAGEAGRASRGMLGLDLRDIASQAESIVGAARAEADRILVEARRQADLLREHAAREGHATGRAQGLEEGRREGEQTALLAATARLDAEQASLVSALSNLLSEFRDRREALLLAARRDVVVLAVVIARRIAERLAALEDVAPEIATEACAEALELVAEASRVLVRAHPKDVAAVRELAAPLAESLQSGRHLRVTEDASVGRGGIVLETPDSQIDGTLTGRIDRIADELVTGWRERLNQWSVKP